MPPEFVADGPDPVEMGTATYTNPTGAAQPTPPEPDSAADAQPNQPQQPGKIVPVPPQASQATPADELMPISEGSITGPSAEDDEDNSIQQVDFVGSPSQPKAGATTSPQKKTLDLNDDQPGSGFQRPLPTQPRRPIMEDDGDDENEELDEEDEEDSFKLPVRKGKAVSMRR